MQWSLCNQWLLTWFLCLHCQPSTTTTTTTEGKSNTFPYLRGLENGDTATSKIKQVASGRFGVTPEFLVNADQLEIKVAQVCVRVFVCINVCVKKCAGLKVGCCRRCLWLLGCVCAVSTLLTDCSPVLLLSLLLAGCSSPHTVHVRCRVPSPERVVSCLARRCHPTLPTCAAPSQVRLN